MEVLELPQSIQDYIERYFNLQIGGKSVRCPYYMNIRRSKDLRALVGKGTPEEIEMEAKIWAKLKNIELETLSAKEIREFLLAQDIGIDCSGFVVHVLNYWYKSEKKLPFWTKFKPLKNSILYRISYFLKPAEKLGAEILSNSENAEKIEIHDVLPGDVIRSKWKRKNAHHILLVSKVSKTKKGQVKEIHYVNSTENYAGESGMRRGSIKIKDAEKPLYEQEWKDLDQHGVNHTLEGFMYQKEDNGIRRIGAMKEIIEKEYS